MDLLHLRPVEGLGNTIEGVQGGARFAYINDGVQMALKAGLA
jgi:hypothetical protein